MIEDEELKRFHNWLQLQGERDDPRVSLALRWIAEFQLYAEEDEEELREIKAHLASRDDPDAAMALEVINWCEETEEPDSMLKRLNDWLQAKGNDPTAVLVGWLLNEFERMQEEDHLSETPSPTLH